jgi:hypothetical protein
VYPDAIKYVQFPEHHMDTNTQKQHNYEKTCGVERERREGGEEKIESE